MHRCLNLLGGTLCDMRPFFAVFLNPDGSHSMKDSLRRSCSACRSRRAASLVRSAWCCQQLGDWRGAAVQDADADEADAAAEDGDGALGEQASISFSRCAGNLVL